MKSEIRSAIYTGEVVHQRFAPKPHRLSYHIFQTLFDLDSLDDDMKRTRLLSRNRFNLFGFYDRDHGPDQDDRHAPLRDRMAAMLRSKGLYEVGDRLFLLAMPRILGFVFNPISLYFVQDRNAALKAVIYEVNNTFGDRHSYVLPVRSDARHIRQRSEKRLHVSPFMDTRDMEYVFDLIAPEATFALKIRLRQSLNTGGQDLLFAGFTGVREPLSDAVLWRLFWAMPLMTLKVVAGIHWEALQIWWKGIKLRAKPPTQKSSVSL